ncbi:MAG: hypothetical protein FJ125_18500 [Deltaproteobacteria bacterium]|nr:hypothetical protein [Deltaproteobacteria bacterium]
MSQQSPRQVDAAAAASAQAECPTSLAERRRRAAQREEELVDILAGAVFDLFLRRLQDKHGASGPGGENESTN